MSACAVCGEQTDDLTSVVVDDEPIDVCFECEYGLEAGLPDVI